MKQVQIGTCGWSYQDWSAVFYPKGTAARCYPPTRTRPRMVHLIAR
jgi:hypothetical protein